MGVLFYVFVVCAFAGDVVLPATDLVVDFSSSESCVKFVTVSGHVVDSLQGPLGRSPVVACLSPGRHVINGERTVLVAQPRRESASIFASLVALEKASLLPNGVQFYAKHVPVDIIKLGSPSLPIQAAFNPSLLNAALGNGGLTVGVGRDTTLTTLHWPAPTSYDHLELFAYNTGLERVPNMGVFSGLEIDGSVSWLFESEWTTVNQSYWSDSDNVLITRLQSSTSVAVEVTDFVVSGLDVFVRRVSASKGNVALYENFAPCVKQIENYAAADWLLDYQNDFAVYFDVDAGAMIHFAPKDPQKKDWQNLLFSNWSALDFGEGVFFAIGDLTGLGPSQIQCGTVTTDKPTLNLTSVSSICESVARSWSAQVFNSSIATIAIAAGKTREDAIFNLGLARKRGFDSLLNETKTFWRDLVSKAEFGNASGVALSIMKRSVVTVFTAMDQQLSHSIAASIDPQLPYALDWPRDSSFINFSLEKMGFFESAQQHALFLASMQRKNGFWPKGSYAQNFNWKGEVGGPVPLEIDEAGLAIWTMGRLLNDSHCDVIVRGLDFFVEWRDPANNLTLPANEDDNLAFTQGIQGCTAVLTGLNEGISFLSANNCNVDSQKLASFVSRRDGLRAAMLEKFYVPSCNCYGANGNLSSSDPNQPLRGMSWTLWPSNLLEHNESLILSQAEFLFSALQPFLKGVPGVYSYIAETSVILARIWRARNIHQDRLLAILAQLVRVVTPGTLHFGEVYELGTDGTFTNLNDVPHCWEAVLFYQFALEVFS